MRRVLVLLEFLVLFGPAIALLGLGLIFLPALVLGAVSGNGGVWLVGTVAVACGAWGIVSAASLALHVALRRKWSGAPVQVFGLGLGVAACVMSALKVDDGQAWMVFAGPLVATSHFLVLAMRDRSDC